MELAKDCECCATLVVFITSEFVEGGQCCATFIPWNASAVQPSNEFIATEHAGGCKCLATFNPCHFHRVCTGTHKVITSDHF